MKLLFAATLTIFILSALDQADSSAYDKILTHSRIRAKNEGPNVCTLQQVMGTKKKYFSTCKNWYRGTICGKKAFEIAGCEHPRQRATVRCPSPASSMPIARRHCSLDRRGILFFFCDIAFIQACNSTVAPIDNVYGTLGLLKAISTQKYSDVSKLREEIEGHGSYTFFAPSNEAWDLLDPEMRSALVSNVNIELYNALHYHMLNKRMLTKDLKNGMTLKSMYNDLGLLINHYPNGVVTVNCARIIHGNQIATNGVVHVIDRVVTAVSNTIQDVIEVEDDLSSLRAAAIASGMLETLGKPGHYTIFAPTNEAFEKLPRAVLERIMSDKVALQALLKFHILDSVQCSEAIMGGESFETLEGRNIEIGCDGESVTINGVKMVKRKDIVTTNGVIHLIDAVLIPDSGESFETLEGRNIEIGCDGESVTINGVKMVKRKDIVTTNGVIHLIDAVLIPDSDEVMTMDQRSLRLLLENHILKLKIVLSQLYNGQRLETLGGKFLRVFIYRTAVCIENSCMVRGSKEGRNGAIHFLRSIIRPAEKSMMEILSEDDRFSMFLTLIEAAGLTEILSQDGDWTLFAPTNDAFDGLSEEEMEILTSDPNALRTILLYHLSNGVFIGGGMEGGVTNLLKSIQGSNLMVKERIRTFLYPKTYQKIFFRIFEYFSQHFILILFFYNIDTIYFHLPPRHGDRKTVYGVSCYRQIEAKALKVRQADVTRETVQKSVCVLSRLPLYGLLQAKLQLITHAYFEEKDFSQISILKELYDHMNGSLRGTSLEGSQVYLGLSPRDLILQFQHKVLILFKLILLEKKVLFYVSPVNRLVGALMTILSLFPGMIEHGLADSSHYKPRKSTSEDLNLIEVLGGSEDYVSVSVSDISNSNQESGGEAKETSWVYQNETHQEDMSQSLTGDDHHLKPPSRTSPDSLESDWETLDPSALDKGAPKEENQEKDSFGLPETFPSESVPSRTLPITVQPQPNTGQAVLVQGLVSGLEEDQFGLPLAVFTKGYLCLPYMALQQHHLLSDVTVRGFVAGATNILFRQQRHLSDAIVDVEEGRIHIQDPELRKVLSLTTADLRFADYLVKHVTENRDDVFLDGTGWEGGDEWIRAQFGLYLHSLLSTNLQQDNEKILADYGAAFVNTWKITHNYRVWYSNKHPALSEITPGSVQNSERGKKLGNAVITTSRSVVQTGKAVGQSVGGALTSAKSAMSSWFSTFAQAAPPGYSEQREANP
ncbi:UNVERIFIED_CONTAM: hypothetical protein FKN15_053455 [Acipenser sinensis]